MSAWEDFKKTKIGSVCTDPAVAFFVGVLGIVIGACVSFYFYKISTKTRDLLYYVNPNTTAIVQPSTLSDLEVAYRGQLITNGFYGQQVAIWNEGKEAIETKDILKQIVIRPPAGIHVLEMRIAKQSRDLTGFEFATNATPEAIALRWNILEFRDGGLVQIFFTGISKDTFTVEGAIRDQPKVRGWQGSVTKGKVGLGFVLLLSSSLCSTLCSFLMARRAARKMAEGKGVIRAHYLSAILLFILVVTIFIVAHFVINYVIQRPVPFNI